MATLVRTAGDRLLGLLLGKVDAGACVPENGQVCYCRFSRIYRYNCYGSCYRTTIFC